MLTFLTLLGVAQYWRVFTTFFGIDDVFFVGDGVLTWPDLRDLFATRFLSYRLLFYLHWQAFGFNPGPYHILGFCLQVLNAWLVFDLYRALMPRRPVFARSAAVLFLIHPAAYTAIAWISLAFNELPTLTLGLIAVRCFLSFLDSARVYQLAIAVGCAVLAAGFKNQAVFIPLYCLALGIVHVCYNVARPRRGFVLLGMGLVPFALFDVWYFVSVLARLEIGRGYEADYSLRSLLTCYGRLLATALNPTILLREGFGFQRPLPASFQQTSFGIVLVYRLLVIASVVTAAVFAVKRQRRFGLLIGLSLTLVGGLSFAAAMSHHQYEYLTYFSLPAACGLLALSVDALTASSRLRNSATGGWRGAILAICYAAVAGKALHETNLFVASANNAWTIDQFVRTGLRSPIVEQVVFLPPNAVAHNDTVRGASMTLLHPERRLTVSFMRDEDVPEHLLASPATVYVAFDDVNERGFQVYQVSDLQGRHDSAILPPDSSREIAQPFRATLDGFSEIQFLLGSWGGRCALEAQVRDLRADQTIARSMVSCPASKAARYVGIPVPRQSLGSLDGSYELSLRVPDGMSERPVILPAGTVVSDAPRASIRLRGMRDGDTQSVAITYRVVYTPENGFKGKGLPQ